MSERKAPPVRKDYGFFIDFKTRWIDNDLYGHVNNVVYYSYFDTLIAEFLINEGGFDPHGDDVVGVAVETGCRFHASLRYPDRIVAGLRIGHLGRSSVRYEIGIFNAAGGTAAADGHFVHVFVERASQRPVPIPDSLRAAMTRIRVDAPPA
jgi:acyl-CoA thioester hydrolase